MSYKTWAERVQDIQKECKNREVQLLLTFDPVEDEWQAALNNEFIGSPCSDLEAVLEDLESELDL